MGARGQLIAPAEAGTVAAFRPSDHRRDYKSPLHTAIAERGSTMITNRTMNPYCCW